jgi:hypothetical protein
VTESQQLAALSVKLKTTPADYEGYIQAEREQLQSLKEEPVEVQQSIDYLEVLLKLAEAKYMSIFLLSRLPLLSEVDFRKESNQAAIEFKRLDFNIIHNGYTGKQITAVKTRYRTMFTCWQVKEEALTRFEEEHEIATRWTPDCDAYKATQTLLVERSYRRAVDNLERLVVQRLFELTKLGMNGVGM